MATAISGSRVKSLRTIIPLSSPGKQKPGPLFLFIYLYVWFTSPGRKWSGRESVLVSTSKLWFPFMYLSGNRPRHNRRLQSIVAETTEGLGHFCLCSHPAAWINVAFERLPECVCLIMEVCPCWSYRCVWHGLGLHQCACVCLRAAHNCTWGLRSGSG